MMDSGATGSLTGQQEWRWNQLQEAKQSQHSTPDTQSGGHRQQMTVQTESRHSPAGQQDTQTLKREVKRLEAELEQTEKQLQAVIRQYERLLSEKNRQLAKQQGTEPRSGALPASIQRLLD